MTISKKEHSITLITVDDHDIYLKGLNMLLEAEPDLAVLASATNGAELQALLPQMQPQVLLLDMQLPDMEPEDLLKATRKSYPKLPILYHTLMRGTRFLQRLKQHEVQGYILKNAPFTQLKEAIAKVAEGSTWYSPELDKGSPSDDNYKSTLTVPDEKPESILSKREIEILQYVCKEYSSADIAAQLFLSVSTVNTHRKNIMAKLGVHNTVGLVKYALKAGLL